MKKTIGLFILVSFVLPNIFAQSSDLGVWYNYFGNKKLNGKLNIHHEVQYRNYNAVGDLEQLLLRVGVGYNLSENNNNILLGYGYILGENYIGDSENKEQTEEHRIFQQFITKQKFRRVSLQHRYRLEERLFKDDFKMRFRYLLGVNIALNHKEMVDKTIYLSGYNELFINNKGTYFDRNRIYGGLGYYFSSKLKVEVAYMNQFMTKVNQRDQFNLACFLTF